MAAFSRYNRSPILNLGAQFGTSDAIRIIRDAIKNNQVSTRELVIKEAQRLDTIAGTVYGDGRYWWIIAAASNIGWAPQVPPGTILNIPELADISRLVG